MRTAEQNVHAATKISRFQVCQVQVPIVKHQQHLPGNIGQLSTFLVITISQGAANKSTSKNLPAKHGLQSLGKVPAARRAPVNLPSEKSEKGENTQ